MRDEPELLIPVSEVMDRRAPEAPALSGWALALWRLWVFVGVVTVGPCACAALFLTNSGSAGELGATLFVVWLAVAWIAKPLLSRSQQR